MVVTRSTPSRWRSPTRWGAWLDRSASTRRDHGTALPRSPTQYLAGLSPPRVRLRRIVPTQGLAGPDPLRRAREALRLDLLASILPSNEDHLRRAVRLIRGTDHRKIGIVGLSFKPGTDDLRESPWSSWSRPSWVAVATSRYSIPASPESSAWQEPGVHRSPPSPPRGLADRGAPRTSMNMPRSWSWGPTSPTAWTGATTTPATSSTCAAI